MHFLFSILSLSEAFSAKDCITMERVRTNYASVQQFLCFQSSIEQCDFEVGRLFFISVLTWKEWSNVSVFIFIFLYAKATNLEISITDPLTCTVAGYRHVIRRQRKVCLWQHKPAIVQYFLISEQSCGIAYQVLLHLEDVRGGKIEVLSVLVRAQCLPLPKYIELD